MPLSIGDQRHGYFGNGDKLGLPKENYQVTSHNHFCMELKSCNDIWY